MTAEPLGTDRCPSCGAAVRFGDPWCTLCYADLRPPAPPPPAPEPEPQLAPVVAPPAYAPPAAARPDPLTAPLAAVTGPSWPCSACGTVNPMAQDTCSSCGQHFLHAARQQGPLLDLPVIGDITRLERGQRFALAFGVVLVVIALTLLVGVLFS